MLLGLATCAIWFRLTVLRPHTFSYLAILAFLVLCEGSERRRWWLIPLTVVWMNLHGVYYPVVLLMLVAYGAEWLVRRARGRADSPSLVVPLSTLVVLVAIFATPHGRALAAVPFISTAAASHYVAELGRIPWLSMWTYDFRAFVPQGLTAAMLLLLLTLVGLAAQAWGRRLRIAHLILALGGIVLMLRAARFAVDFSILTLPLLRELGPELGLDRLWHRRRPAGVLVALLALVPAYALLGRDVERRPGVGPISQRNEPHGAAAFITRLGVAGRVMCNPNDGGYLLWALPRRNPIFMEMEIPFLFHDEDWFEIKSAYFTENGLSAFLERHRPAFVLGPLDSPTLARWLAVDHPDYRPVFFDDQRVVWADRRQLPEVTAAWELEVADPTLLRRADDSRLSAEQRARLGGELERLAGVAGGGVLVSGARAQLALAEGEPRAALERVAEGRRLGLEDGWLSGIEAAAWSALGDHAAAVEALERGLATSDGDPTARASLLRSLADELDDLGRPAEAYRARVEAIGGVDPLSRPEDLLELAAAAHRAGRDSDARGLLQRVDSVLPAEDPRRAQSEALRAKLTAD